MQIGRLHARRRALELRVHILRVDGVGIAPPRVIAKVGIEVTLVRKRGPGRPRDLELLRRLERLPRLVGDHADEVLLDDDLHVARHTGNGALVNVRERRAD